MKKKLKIKFDPRALENFPEEEREAIKKEIEEMFDGVEDPCDLPNSRPLECLPPGVHICPECGNGLVPVGPVFDDDGEPTQILDCEDCDISFVGDPFN